MEQESLDFDTATDDDGSFIAAVLRGNKSRILELTDGTLNHHLGAPEVDLHQLLLETPCEAIFERLVVAAPRIKSSAEATVDLLRSGLARHVPLRRMIRLLQLVSHSDAEPWQALALQAAIDAGNNEVASLVLPFCGPEMRERHAADIARLRAVPAGIAASLDLAARRARAACLLDAARKGQAARLRQLFRHNGLLYHALEVSPSDRLMDAAIESGSRETEEVVFANTSILHFDWLLKQTLHTMTQPEPGDTGDATADVLIDAAQPVPAPATLPLCDEAEIDAFMERISVMDKDVSSRVSRMVTESFHDRGFEREIGRPIRPEALEPLKETFPLFASLIEDIQARASLLWRVEQSSGQPQAMRLPNVLIVGKPGWGKTYFIHRLGECLGLPFHSVQMSSMSAGFILAGTDPTWSTSRPGMIHDTLARGTRINPIFLLDEIDKVGGDSRYPADGPLYQLLEPAHARTFRDECLSYPIDASHINWFASANDLDRAHPAIVSRFDIYEMPEITPEIARQTARSVYADSLARSPWASLFESTPSESVIERLAEYSPREAHRRLQKAFGRASLANRASLSPDDFDPLAGSVRRTIGFVR